MAIHSTLIAQSRSDCNSGYIICDYSSVQLTQSASAGDNPSELDSFTGECHSQEYQSTWFRWQCEESGNFHFTITPNDYVPGGESSDIDFAVFRLPSGIHNCEDKEMLRCMASGETGGCDFDDWIFCNGPTGLSVSSTDTAEQAGCTQCSGGNDDNFVSAIDLEAGVSYALVVMKYSHPDIGFRIDWDGTAVLQDLGQACEQLMISSSEDFKASRPFIHVYPNPVTHSLTFRAENFSRKLKVKVYNSHGKKVASFKLKDLENLDVTDLPPGLYYFRTPMDERIKTGKFIKI